MSPLFPSLPFVHPRAMTLREKRIKEGERAEKEFLSLSLLVFS